MASPHLVAPSVLAADFLHLDRDIQMINQSQADWVHFDVMDGRFVPNISFGFPLLKAIRKATTKFIDVHLMIEEPATYISEFQQLGADQITIHQEAEPHLDRALTAIRESGIKAGVALNPATPVASLQHILPLADTVLLMTVNPGYGGQQFIPYVLEKVQLLKRMIEERGSNTLIEIDGGVNIELAPALIQAGADVLVAGSAVFKAEDPIDMIKQLKGARPKNWA